MLIENTLNEEAKGKPKNIIILNKRKKGNLKTKKMDDFKKSISFVSKKN